VVKPDIVAPGNDIVSLAAPGATLEALYPAELVTGNDGNNDYFTLSGTSMATPVWPERLRCSCSKTAR
jgi:serine protease AprX